ncbi:Ras guanine nucleotide exchange factor P [Termitomyces sp. J132]|nr:Ras guanine nucleotide exchange factor P [Termitomyces sp. J132]
MIVVGTAGCGKSTAIRHGTRGRLQGTFSRCSYWDGELSHEGSTHPLRVVEIDVPSVLVEPLDWLDNSTINGVLICYDTSYKVSFNPVEELLRYYKDLKLPTNILACKNDTQPEVGVYEAHAIARQYSSEFALVTKSNEDGLRKAFVRLYECIIKDEQDKGKHRSQGSEYQDLVSPSILYDHQSRKLLKTTPTISSVGGNDQEETKTSPKTGHQSFLTSPVQSRSSRISYEKEYSAVTLRGSISTVSGGLNTSQKAGPDTTRAPDAVKDGVEPSKPKKEKEHKEKESNPTRPGQWATLDDLLNKLLFLAVSGDDPSYITHFLLTYRRFACPRSVVLKMQSRIRELDEKSSGDPMFACFAQMRICHLLELWIRDYPHDFAVRGTASALSALIMSIISKTHLLHYGSELLPFLEMLPTLIDHDAAWAMKLDTADENDDLYEDEEAHLSGDDSVSPSPVQEQPDPISAVVSRERKSSFPLPSRLAIGLKANIGQSDMDVSEKQLVKDLLKVSQEIQALEPEEIAQEITRIEVKLFLDIKPRHWLAYTFVSGRKDGKDPISAFNAVSNHLADWVVSLILCHKTPRARVKQIEKLVEIAQRLRALNNYSALRAFVAGINNATFAGDETMEQFKAKSPDQAKNLQSWDVLLQHIRSHRAYRLALRNSKGACIPALEVHMSDLIKAHEGNGDFHSSDHTKIHWGKFNMMGKFISSTAQCQAQCRTAADYNFTERTHIKELLLKPVMTLQMQKSRIAPIETEVDDYRSAQPGGAQPRDAAILRKLIFW